MKAYKAFGSIFSGRKLEVFHSAAVQKIQSFLEQIKLGANQVLHDKGFPLGDVNAAGTQERGPLLAAFSINSVLFVAELVAGILAYSLGLVADSLDMLADAVVYGMALAAVGGPALRKHGEPTT